MNTNNAKNENTNTAKRVKVYLALAGLKGQAIKAGGVKAGRYILKAGENEVSAIIDAQAKKATAVADWQAVRACKESAKAFAPAGGFVRRSAAIVAAASWVEGTPDLCYLAEGLAKELAEAERTEAAWKKHEAEKAAERAQARAAYKATPEYKAAQAAKAKATAEARAQKVLEKAQARAAKILERAKIAA